MLKRDYYGNVEEDDSILSEEDMEYYLAEAIETWWTENKGENIKTGTFHEHGVLTNNKGLVVKIGRQEFQITIVRSKG